MLWTISLSPTTIWNGDGAPSGEEVRPGGHKPDRRAEGASVGGEFKGAGKGMGRGSGEAAHEMKKGKPVASGKEAGRRFFTMAWRQQTSWLLCLNLVALAAVVEAAPAQTGSTVPNVEAIVARMAQARAENRARSRPYTVTREYKLYGKERQAAKSQVVADVTFVPPDSKKYTIQQINGSGLGKMIIGRMLKREAEFTKDYGTTDISPDNYDFRFIREEEVSGQRCYVLEMLPRRKDKNLLRGNIWVDANTYLLRRTEGQPAKTPSWWVQDVRIALRYGDVGGMWLQTASEATARVRILGPCTMVSRDVKYKISEVVVVASASPLTKRVSHAEQTGESPRGINTKGEGLARVSTREEPREGIVGRSEATGVASSAQPRRRMHILWWIVVGLVAGWATGKIMRGSGYGVLMDIVLGIAGALIGGFLMQSLGYASQGGLLYTIVVAIGGAVILTAVARFFFRVTRA
jgi:uncharacterized membrane protein YeaQ/YmgE (transglycosylase-associated protein family)